MGRHRSDAIFERKTGERLGALILFAPFIGAVLTTIFEGLKTAVFAASLAYGGMLIIPLLWYAFWRAKRYRKLEVTYRDLYALLSNSLKLHKEAELQLSQSLRRTQSGSYDERSSRGKWANEQMKILGGYEDDFTGAILAILSKDRKDAFYKAATLIYVGVIVWLSLHDWQVVHAATIAMLASLAGAWVWKAVKSLGPQPPSKPPTVSIVGSVIIMGIWTAGATYTYWTFERERTAAHGERRLDLNGAPPTMVMNEALQQEEEAPAAAAVISRSSSAAFLTVVTGAKPTPSVDDASTVWLPQGAEVEIIEETDDHRWFKIREIEHGLLLFVPVENVARIKD